MALGINFILGCLLVALGLGIYAGWGPFPGLAAGFRDRLRGVLGESLEVHDWVFAGAALLLGGLALLSAFSQVARSQYFWVLG